jgi:uncharacterized protein with LGFP repeats
VVLGGAGAVTYAVADPSADPAVDAARGKRPVKVHELAMKSDGSGRRKVERTSTRQFSLLGLTWTGSKTELDGTAQVRTRDLATGDWTGWQNLDLEPHPVDKAEPDAKEARGASDPLWVGPSDGVEARVVAADGSASSGLPKGLEVTLVDPGVTSAEAKNKALGTTAGTSMENAAFVAEDPTGSPTPTDPASGSPSPTDSPSTEPTTGAPASPTASTTESSSPSASASPTPDPVPSPPPSTVTQPPVISRAQWGADESTVQDPPEYIDKVSAVFVHHTVGTNDYSCAESPALARGIMAYHVQGEKWNDLGYNFLVDKCGRIFEGRAGGIDLPVRGAHTYGFNGDSAGIAVLGDFEGAPATATTPAKPAGKPTRATLESVARVAAWKLGQYGGNPSGQVTLTAGADTGVYKAGEQATLNTISGHRDGFATLCPGKNLYSKLSEIRRYASSPGKNSAIPTADFNRDGITDLAAGVPKASSDVGNVVIVPGGLNGPVSASKVKLTQSSAGVPGVSEKGDLWGAATAWGDINGDGHADLAIGAPGEDDGSGHADRGAVTILYGPKFDTGADTMALGDDYEASGAKFGATVAVGDFNADGKADVFTAATGTRGNWAARFTEGLEVAGPVEGGHALREGRPLHRRGRRERQRLRRHRHRPAVHGRVRRDLRRPGHHGPGHVHRLHHHRDDEDHPGHDGCRGRQRVRRRARRLGLRGRLQRRRLRGRPHRRPERGHHPQRHQPLQRGCGLALQGHLVRSHRHRFALLLPGHDRHPRLHGEGRQAGLVRLADGLLRPRPRPPAHRHGGRGHGQRHAAVPAEHGLGRLRHQGGVLRPHPAGHADGRAPGPGTDPVAGT